MNLPFTAKEFLEVFKNYNSSVYPLQAVFMLLAAFILLILFIKNGRTNKFILYVLGMFWLWMGTIYHIGFFSEINPAAYLFGALFILESIFLFIAATKSITFSLGKNMASVIGILLAVYALIIYPLIGYYSGHRYPGAPTFGLPCPTTIFTFAIFSLSKKRVPAYLIMIPLIWSFIGFSAAITLGIYEDIALIFAGLGFAMLNFTKPKRLSLQPVAS